MRQTYVRHAERFGTDLVFETAADDLPLRELGYLSLRLQRIDAKWRLPVDGAVFAERLIADGVDERDALRMGMVTRRTLQRRRQLLGEVAQDAKRAREPAFQSGEIATNQGREGNHPRVLDLSLAGP